MPFLDQIEEGEALVAVVLGDRDHQPQVRLDHPFLRVHVAALDPLRELDLLGCRQELMPAGLPQEELERISRRLDRSGQRDDGLRVRRLLDDLDRSLVELAQHRILLELRELVGLRDLRQIGRADRANLLCCLEQLPDLLDEEDVLDVDLGHAAGWSLGGR